MNGLLFWPTLCRYNLFNQFEHLDMPATELATAPPPERTPSKLKLTYDIAMLVAIIVDLTLMALDAILMSGSATYLSAQYSFAHWVVDYRAYIHEPLRTAGEFFTLFLVIELLVRWAIAIKDSHHYRWFFFPFIHWYEVLGCLPQLRALRLLRAVVIGRRLYQLGYRVLPKSWLGAGKFYLDVLLEELSDRVILTAIGNVRQQLLDKQSTKALISQTIKRNQVEIEAAIVALLKQSLSPYLDANNGRLQDPAISQALALEVGAAIQEGLAKTPELHRYLRLIPIAGTLIESQLSQIGQHVGENVVLSLNKRLLASSSLDKVLQEVAHGIVSIDISNPAFESLLITIIEDALTGLEEQVKVQQWKHHQYLKL